MEQEIYDKLPYNSRYVYEPRPDRNRITAKAVQKRIKAFVEGRYLDAQYKAVALIERKMDACSLSQLMKVCD